MKAFNLFRYNNNNVNFAEFIDIYVSKKYFHISHTLGQTISALLQSSKVENYNTIFNVYMFKKMILLMLYKKNFLSDLLIKGFNKVNKNKMSQ